MKERDGYFFDIDEENRISLVNKNIEKDQSFTDAVSSLDWENKKTEIFFISYYGNLTYAALAHKGNKVLTGKNRIRFTNFVRFSPPISLHFLEDQIKNNLKHYFVRSAKGTGKKTPPQTWSAVMDFIKTRQPETAAKIDELYKIRDEEFVLPTKDVETLAEEKDATNIALRIAGFEKTEVLNWSPTNQMTSYIEGLDGFKIIEDRMIEHDTRVFGSWSYLKSHMVGAVEFIKDGEKLLIMNANRGDIEHSMGVDMIYYFEKFDSYLIIQYKRMDGESGKAIYRPIDKAYSQEIEILRALRSQLHLPFSQSGNIREYRLNHESIYFKLCPKSIFEVSSTEMIPGMYIPFDYWEELLVSQSIQGPRGGVQITYDNIERHLTNSLFIDLAQSGWIGSKSLTSSQIYGYVKAAIEGDRSMMFAYDKTNIKRKKYY